MNLRYRLQTKLILSYMLLAVLTVGLISYLVNFSISSGFESYVINKHGRTVQALIEDLQYSYSTTGEFNLTGIEHLGIAAIEDGLIIRIMDSSHNLIWSATDHNAGLCEAMITNVRLSMFDHDASWDGHYTEETYPLVVDDTAYAELTVGYLGPYYFNEEELYFLSSINRVLARVGIMALLLSSVIGVFMAGSITRPVKKIIRHLNRIHSVYTADAEPMTTHTSELQTLFESARSLEMRIHEQERLRKQLTQDMAHELKTPLTAIQGTLEAMIDGIYDTSAERLHSCHEEIIRIKDLVQEVESLSVIENRNLELNRSETDFEVILTDVYETLKSGFESQSMTFDFTLQQGLMAMDPSRLLLDTSKIKQVFLNLIENAVKYAGEGSEIIVTIDVDEDTLKVIFADNGIGVPEEELTYLFERFYRVDRSRTGHNGLGIGLTVVKAIIQNHNGSIEARQTQPKGLTIAIELPIPPAQ